MTRLFQAALAVALVVGMATPAAAQLNVADPSAMFSYDQKINDKLPLDLAFSDEEGHDVEFGSYFGKRPVVFAMVQYRCPRLCNEVLDGMTRCLAEMGGTPGQDYDVVVVSFDPREKTMPELGKNKKAAYLDEYVREYQRNKVKAIGATALTAAEETALGASLNSSWHFLTGDIASIESLALEVGFRFAYDRKGDRYAHPSGIVVLSPKGVCCRYFDGILFRSADVRDSIAKAGREEVGRPMRAWDRVLLLCYDYDADTGTLKANVMKIVRTASVVTVVALALFLCFGSRFRRRLGTVPPAGSTALFVPSAAPSTDGVSTLGEIRS